MWCASVRPRTIIATPDTQRRAKRILEFDQTTPGTSKPLPYLWISVMWARHLLFLSFFFCFFFLHLLFKPVCAEDHVCLKFSLPSLPLHGDSPPENKVKSGEKQSQERQQQRLTAGNITLTGGSFLICKVIQYPFLFKLTWGGSSTCKREVSPDYFSSVSGLYTLEAPRLDYSAIEQTIKTTRYENKTNK